MTNDEAAHNLLDLPWIRVLDLKGHEQQLGLTEVFNRAPTLSQVVGELPTQVFAITRLMLAIVHRAVDGPASIDHWVGLRADWPAVAADVHDYLAEHRERFYLSHATAPFFQVAGLQTRKGPADVARLEKLIADVPNGIPFFTTRLGRGLGQVTWAEAARWLVHCQAFDSAGLRPGADGTRRRLNPNGTTPPEGTGWCGQIGGLLVEAPTLAESLLLNLVALSAVPGMEVNPADAPCWERTPLSVDPRDPVGPEGIGSEPTGPLDLYTWQARRVRLVGGVAGVSGVVLCAGDRMTGHNRHGTEPMTGWRLSEPQSKKYGRTVYMPREHDPERALWRGLGALLPQAPGPSAGRDTARSLRPALLSWMSVLRNESLLPDRAVFAVRALGLIYGSNNSTVAEIIDDRLMLPISLLADNDTDLHLVALDQVAVTEKVAMMLGDFGRDVARAAGCGTVEAEGARDRARESLFAAVDQPFRAWLGSLDATEDERSRGARWQSVAWREAMTVREQIVSSASPAAFVGRAVNKRHLDLGLADAWLMAKLRSTLQNRDAATEEAADDNVA